MKKKIPQCEAHDKIRETNMTVPRRNCTALSINEPPVTEQAFEVCFFPSRGYSCNQVVRDPVETCKDRVVWGWSVDLLIEEERGTVSCSVYLKYQVAVSATALLPYFMIFHLAQESWHK